MLERLIVRRFYGRELGALVVTWGISLILSQGTLLLLGPFMPSIPIPGGSFAVGVYSFSVYWIGLIVIAAAGRPGAVVALQPHHVRPSGARHHAERRHGRALGVDTGRVYMLTFSLGAGLAGLQRCPAGTHDLDRALHGPAVRGPRLHHRGRRRGHQRDRRRGRQLQLLLSLVKTPVGFLFGAFLGTVALLLAALVIIRLMPDGISAAIQRRLDQRATARADARRSASSPGPRISAGRRGSGSPSPALVGFLCYYAGLITEFEASNIAYYLLNIPMALGLCLLWGYCGVLSFGQVAYFGIAGYAYGIIAGNMIGNPWGAAHRLARRARGLRRRRRASSAISSSTPGCRCGSPRS